MRRVSISLPTASRRIFRNARLAPELPSPRNVTFSALLIDNSRVVIANSSSRTVPPRTDERPRHLAYAASRFPRMIHGEPFVVDSAAACARSASTRPAASHSTPATSSDELLDLSKDHRFYREGSSPIASDPVASPRSRGSTPRKSDRVREEKPLFDPEHRRVFRRSTSGMEIRQARSSSVSRTRDYRTGTRSPSPSRTVYRVPEESKQVGSQSSARAIPVYVIRREGLFDRTLRSVIR